MGSQTNFTGSLERRATWSSSQLHKKKKKMPSLLIHFLFSTRLFPRISIPSKPPAPQFLISGSVPVFTPGWKSFICICKEGIQWSIIVHWLSNNSLSITLSHATKNYNWIRNTQRSWSNWNTNKFKSPWKTINTFHFISLSVLLVWIAVLIVST